MESKNKQVVLPIPLIHALEEIAEKERRNFSQQLTLFSIEKLKETHPEVYERHFNGQ